MKKNIILLVLLSIGYVAMAQDSIKIEPKTIFSNIDPWCVDFNFMLGGLSQQLNSISLSKKYENPLNIRNGNLNFNGGFALLSNIQVGYFFDKNRHFGLGLGLMGNFYNNFLNLDTFHVEYQSTDKYNSTFRQVLSTSSPVQEKIFNSNFNIPVVFKYKTQISKYLSFTNDIGFLLNFSVTNSYTTNAAFNYEAIYKYSLEGGKPVAIYDYSPAPGKTDVLFLQSNMQGNVAHILDSLRNVEGFNVGLGKTPSQPKGKVSYQTGNIGFIISPNLSYSLTKKISLNFGGYYTYQHFKNSSESNYKVTDAVGTYNSLLHSVTSTTIQSYGINIGLRYFFGKAKDSDHDGIPDKLDRCPQDSGLVEFKGCPDSDHDGIPDVDDSCPHEFGIAKFNGCPDSDGDGIMDKEDSCPHQFGLLQFHGCPDSDKDGIPDKDDSCPHQAGLPQFNGCPDSDGDGIPDNLDACPFVAGPADNNGCPIKQKSDKQKDDKKIAKNIEMKELDKKQIHFDFNKYTIKKSSLPYLNKIIRTMKDNPETVLTIDGYSDNVGKKAANIRVSIDRALEVKRYMVKKGIESRRLKARGHGFNLPVASNKTQKGRAKNRRATLIVKDKSNKHIIENSSAIQVTPNEEKGSFTILLKTNFEENATVIITNKEGKKVKEFTITANKPTEFTLDAPAGMYLFTASTANTKYEARIIIAK